MQINLKNRTTKSIAKSAWIDDLSEEENKVLQQAHARDERMRTAKPQDHMKSKIVNDLKKINGE
jgi:hypothetical protein